MPDFVFQKISFGMLWIITRFINLGGFFQVQTLQRNNYYTHTHSQLYLNLSQQKSSPNHPSTYPQKKHLRPWTFDLSSTYIFLLETSIFILKSSPLFQVQFMVSFLSSFSEFLKTLVDGPLKKVGQKISYGSPAGSSL